MHAYIMHACPIKFTYIFEGAHAASGGSLINRARPPKILAVLLLLLSKAYENMPCILICMHAPSKSKYLFRLPRQPRAAHRYRLAHGAVTLHIVSV